MAVATGAAEPGIATPSLEFPASTSRTVSEKSRVNWGVVFWMPPTYERHAETKLVLHWRNRRPAEEVNGEGPHWCPMPTATAVVAPVTRSRGAL